MLLNRSRMLNPSCISLVRSEYQVILLPWQWFVMPVCLQDLLRDPAGTKGESLTSALERGVMCAPEADEIFSFHETMSLILQRYEDSLLCQYLDHGSITILITGPVLPVLVTIKG